MNCLRLRALHILTIGLLLSGCGGSPDLPSGAKVEVDIESDMSTAEVARLLRTAGVIDNELIFRFRCWYEARHDRFLPGRYRFPRGCSPRACIRVLTGKAPAYLMVTIPEGFTMRQIARLLAESRICDSTEFLAACSDTLLLRRLGIPFTTAEGFLFPETYELITGTEPARVVERLVRQFWTVVAEITGNSRPGNRQLVETVIIASIVEKEALVAHERPIIAGVFLNRLRHHIPLMSCATVEYILPSRKPVLDYADTRIQSPYNTYLHPGLPPGPICNPGRASLEAALNPGRHDYLFFVSNGDGTHTFSRTSAEHDAATRRVGAGRR